MNSIVGDSECEIYSESSDGEDKDDNESAYDGHCRSILSSLDESIGKIDEFLACERVYVQGDIVCSITDPSGQLGRVVDVDIIVDLETISGALIKGVNSKNLLKVCPFASGDYVVHGPWLGRVSKVFDLVTILFNDGAKCEIMTGDPDVLPPTSFLFEDFSYPHYPGQCVRVKCPTIFKSARWLCGSWKASRYEGTVCHVEVGLVDVRWIASVMICQGYDQPAPNHLQNPKKLVLLSCFPYANWQLGDWCTLSFDYFSDLLLSTKQTDPQKLPPQRFTKMHKELGVMENDLHKIHVIAKSMTKVDVLWQNGLLSVGLDSQTLLPVANVGDQDFLPGQFVLERVTYEDVNGKRMGIVKNVHAKERTVKVKWIVPEIKEHNNPNGGSIEEIVSAYELIEHPDFSYYVGDIVCRLFPHAEKLDEDVRDVQNNGGIISHESSINAMGNSSVHCLGKDTIEKHMCDCHDGYPTGYLSCIGIVAGFNDEKIEVKWASGLISKVHPSEIYGLDRFDDPSSIPVLMADSSQESISRLTAERSQSLYEQQEVVNDTGENCKRYLQNATMLLFPQAIVRFLCMVATSLFGSLALLSGLAKSGLFESADKTRNCDFISPLLNYTTETLLEHSEVNSKLQIIKTEELCLEVDDSQPQCLKQKKVDYKQYEQAEVLSGGRQFKLFDLVGDYTDHHFANSVDKGLVKKGWLKKIHKEWSILETNLPDGIFVRVYEEKIDLMRVAIIGTSGTPYHDGLFIFDIFFPPDYPHEPPLVHYQSGGLRLNPNLYESGKVCLSLLGTWTGTGSEVWNPENSNILQVLLSLQALVLNDKPYFNEAGYDKLIGQAEGERNSINYNENAFLVTSKLILYLLRKPPKHFEALVEEHFTERAHGILLACKAYMDGAQVGHAFATGSQKNKSSSTGFKIMLAKIFPLLVSGFTEKGIDCSQFMDQINWNLDTGKEIN